MTGTLHECQYTFFIISRLFSSWNETSDKSYREIQNTLVFSNFFFSLSKFLPFMR